ncbi:MAG: GNAT family N-acetyltransferase [Candidatus Krumholzibacteriota bacterium]|nr:GNAT family N-acetyltransferase [Candidatus Krumholzibacteriota bacterium]
MDGLVFKVTELNPRLEMDIRDLVEAAGAGDRWIPGGDLFARFDSEGSALGIAGAREFELDCLIELVVVREDWRGKGIGSGLVNKILGYYAGECERVFALADNYTVDFFARFGFESGRRERLPEAIRDFLDIHGVEIASMVIMDIGLPRKWPII